MRYNYRAVFPCPQSPRLTYLPVGLEDLEAFHEIVTDSYLRRYFMDGEVIVVNWSRQVISKSPRNFGGGAAGLWRISESDRPEKMMAIGGFWPHTEGSPLELIYAIHPNFTGQNFATEIVGSLVDYARTHSHLDTIEASVDEQCIASIRVLQKQGFQRIKDRPGQFGRILRFSLLSGRVPSVLPTPRCFLRTWTDEDLDPFALLNADPRVMEFFPAPLTRMQSDALASRIRIHFAEKGFGLWALEGPRELGFIGYVGLSSATFSSYFTPCVEIGWRLAARHWGQGYATEAAKVALRAAFIHLGLDEVYSFTSVLNSRSERVMRNLGMSKEEKKFEHPLIPEGSSLSLHTLYRIDHASWRLLQKAVPHER